MCFTYCFELVGACWKFDMERSVTVCCLCRCNFTMHKPLCNFLWQLSDIIILHMLVCNYRVIQNNIFIFENTVQSFTFCGLRTITLKESNLYQHDVFKICMSQLQIQANKKFKCLPILSGGQIWINRGSAGFGFGFAYRSLRHA